MSSQVPFWKDELRGLKCDIPHADEINFTYTKIHSTLSNLNDRI